MLTLISASLIEWRVNLRDLNFHYFSPQILDSLKNAIVLSEWRSAGIMDTEVACRTGFFLRFSGERGQVRGEREVQDIRDGRGVKK